MQFSTRVWFRTFTFQFFAFSGFALRIKFNPTFFKISRVGRRSLIFLLSIKRGSILWLFSNGKCALTILYKSVTLSISRLCRIFYMVTRLIFLFFLRRLREKKNAVITFCFFIGALIRRFLPRRVGERRYQSATFMQDEGVFGRFIRAGGSGRVCLCNWDDSVINGIFFIPNYTQRFPYPLILLKSVLKMKREEKIILKQYPHEMI